MALLSGSLVPRFVSTKRIFHSPVLGILFCLSVIVLARLCVFGIDVSIRKVFFVFSFKRFMSGRLEGIVLCVIMLRFSTA